jgi:hypothetical protein
MAKEFQGLQNKEEPLNKLSKVKIEDSLVGIVKKEANESTKRVNVAMIVKEIA